MIPFGMEESFMEAYCVKCRQKREMKDESPVQMKNGRDALEGKCPVCDTKLFRMLGGPAGDGETRPAASKKKK